tara:strand:- start:180 stop:779 length:600 start_codon:yes stop_codon:yes gene_type:complete
MNKNKLSYFTYTKKYYQFIILKKIDENGFVKIPLENEDSELIEAISQVHLNNLLNEDYLYLDKNKLKLTDLGVSTLNKHFIDYQISIMNLSKDLEKFYSNKITWLKKEIVGSVALYGASDTSKSFFNFIKNAGIKLECVIDDDKNKQNKNYLKLPVISIDELEKFSVKTIIISSIKFQKKIKNNINANIHNKYKIINLF